MFILKGLQNIVFLCSFVIVIECIPLIFGETITPSGVSPSIPLWHWPFGVVLFVVMLHGIYSKTKYFFINPCKKCVWKEYADGSTCGSHCHVRRKYDYFRWMKRLF